MQQRMIYNINKAHDHFADMSVKGRTTNESDRDDTLDVKGKLQVLRGKHVNFSGLVLLATVLYLETLAIPDTHTLTHTQR